MAESITLIAKLSILEMRDFLTFADAFSPNVRKGGIISIENIVATQNTAWSFEVTVIINQMDQFHTGTSEELRKTLFTLFGLADPAQRQ